MSATQPSFDSWYYQLPRLGTPDQFHRVRSFFDLAGYTFEGLCKRLDVEMLEGFSAPPPGGRPIADSLDALIALFFDGSPVEEKKLAEMIPADTLAVLDELGLLVRGVELPGAVFAPVALLPAFGFLTICDRAMKPDGTRCRFPADVVYPPVFGTTEGFIQELPDSPCDAMLDLGTGTGVAAFRGAAQARHVWATDILSRAVHFTEFNRRLAGIGNVIVLEGDLYGAVEGLTFDRIVIHPPYVPVQTPRYVFADAGDDGEQIIRRAVEGLPQFLRPGGRFHSLLWATDREGEPFEERLRKWLGPQRDQFDILLAVHFLRKPFEYLATGELQGKTTPEASRNWMALWKRTRTVYMVYPTVLIERHAAPREALTRRVTEGVDYSARDLEHLLDWLTACRAPDHVEMLLNSRPVAAPDLELRVVRRLHEGSYRKEEFRLEVSGPFRASFACEEWLADVIPACDGVKTWSQHFDTAISADVIRADVMLDDFAALLGMLVAAGALRV